MTNPLPRRAAPPLALAMALAIASFAAALRADGAFPAPATFAKAAVAADSAVASAVGADVLRAGGNAVDAAVATALALGVVHPESSGIGGGGFLVLWRAADKTATTLDFRETAPAAASHDMYIVDGAPRGDLSAAGGLAVAVPGEVAGLFEAHRAWGKLPWKKLVAPAVRLATAGFAIDPALAQAIADRKEDLAKSPELKALYLRADGTPRAAGETVKNAALGKTLARIAAAGRAGFYEGAIAAELARAVTAAGGVLTAADLAAYAPKVRAALHGTYRGADVYTMPPPSSGGVALLEALALLEKRDLAALGFGSSRYYHAVIEAMKHAFADRAAYLGDTDFVTVPVATMLSPAYATALAARIDAKAHPPAWYGGAAAGLLPPPPKPTDAVPDHGTTHLAVVDAEGNVAALTTTVNLGFGAKLVGGTTGVLLNDEMDDFAIRPGVPNAFGLIQSENNSIAPGKRPLSSMTPVVVVRGGAPVFTAGGAGGPLIISSVLEATLAVLDFGKDPMAALGAPRVHHQWLPDALLVEADVPADVTEALAKMGHVVKPLPFPSVVQAITIDPATGVRSAASDPRKRGGAPAGF